MKIYKVTGFDIYQTLAKAKERDTLTLDELALLGSAIMDDFVEVKDILIELKSIQAEWKNPSKEGTFTDPRMMIDSLIEQLEKANTEGTE